MRGRVPPIERRPRSAMFMILGGFAAPLFLLLAGFAAPLGRERVPERNGQPSIGSSRGHQPRPESSSSRSYSACRRSSSAPATILHLFRVDILNIMGPASWQRGPGAIWRGRRRPSRQSWRLAATAVAMATPVFVRAGWVDALPTWFQWYMRPSGEFTTFTLFPWAGFVFAGAAVGACLCRRQPGSPGTSADGGAGGMVGAALIGLGFYTATLPSLYAASSFWTSSPTYFAIRVGIHGGRALRRYTLWRRPETRGYRCPVQRLGRSSLFVYWIHVELVYGYASWLLRRQLPLPATCVAYVAFVLLMYGAVILRDRALQAKPLDGLRRAHARILTVS